MEGLGGYNKVKSDFHTLNARLNYQIPGVDGLQVYLKGTIDLNHQNTQKYSKPVALYLWNEETQTSSVDPKTIYPTAKIKMEDRWQTINNKLIEFGVNYNRTFAEKHDVSGLVVLNYQDYNNKYLNGINNNLPGEYPEIMGNTSTGTINGSEYFSQRASVVGRATYGFSSRYFAEFSFRVDGSTRFAPGHRWGFFPTVSASWVISNENFFHNVNPGLLSFAKLRASAGILGDDGGVSDYSYLKQYIFSPPTAIPSAATSPPAS